MDVTDSVHILHRSGAPRHYSAIEYSAKYNVEQYEYTFIKPDTVKGIKLPTLQNPKKALTNVTFMSKAVFHKNKNIIIGAPPFDIRSTYFNRLADRHNIVYHTSWPFWNGYRVPKSTRSTYRIKSWEEFLESVTIVTVTDAARKSVEKFGFSAKTIPHCVNTDLFRPSGDEGDHNKVLFVGRLVREKGIRYLLDAIKDLQTSEVRFEFVGDGPLRNEIVSASKQLPVDYLGYINSQRKLAKKISNSDLLVLPSIRDKIWEELFGIVLIEAMACGTPVVATDCIGPSEVVNDGKTGLLIPQKDSSAIVEAIEYLLEADQLREKMARRCRSVAVEKYDIEKIAKEWESTI